MLHARAKDWDDLPLLMSVTEIRSAIGLSKYNAYAVANAVGLRIGRRLMVPKATLRDWLENHATRSPVLPRSWAGGIALRLRGKRP